MRNGSTEQDRHLIRLLHEGAERQRRDFQARAVEARADSTPFKPGSKAEARYLKLMTDFVSLVKTVDHIEAEVERREIAMAKRELTFAADADRPPTHDQPQSIDKRDPMMVALDRINKRLDAMEARGGPPGDEDLDDEFDKIAVAAKKTDAVDPDAGMAPPLTPTPGAKPSAQALDSTRRMALSELQARFDSVSMLWGQQAPRPMDGERPRGYTLRLLQPFAKYHPDWKGIALDALDAPTLKLAQAQILAAAADASKRPTVAPGHLHKREISQDGHRVTTFYGSPSAWLSQFGGGGRRYAKHIASAGEIRMRQMLGVSALPTG